VLFLLWEGRSGMMDWKDSFYLALFLTLVSVLGNYIADCIDHIVRMILE
jgi:hypothetical protein